MYASAPVTGSLPDTSNVIELPVRCITGTWLARCRQTAGSRPVFRSQSKSPETKRCIPLKCATAS